MEILQQLVDIYKKKHPRDWQEYFNKMANDLIETNDISKADYIKFCAENDISIRAKRTISKPSSSSSSGASWGCGSSNTNTRGGC